MIEPRLLSRYLEGSKQSKAAPSMLDLMVDKVGEVNQMQQRADSMVHQLLTGGDVNSAEVLTSVQKADMAFRTMLQVRNKLIEAYREVLQIQV
jgi:flagellar hook-basal body complex protein FliE